MLSAREERILENLMWKLEYKYLTFAEVLYYNILLIKDKR